MEWWGIVSRKFMVFQCSSEKGQSPSNAVLCLTSLCYRPSTRTLSPKTSLLLTEWSWQSDLAQMRCRLMSLLCVLLWSSEAPASACFVPGLHPLAWVRACASTCGVAWASRIRRAAGRPHLFPYYVCLFPYVYLFRLQKFLCLCRHGKKINLNTSLSASLAGTS